MDISPQFLKDLKLSDAFRGYDRNEVDELIERMGAAFGQLQARLREALERAEIAEARAAVGGRSESEETLRRTLVLAQRTADAAIAEANAEASRTLAEANERATRALTEADERASRTVNEANERAARTMTDADERATRTVTEADDRAARALSDANERAAQLIADAESHAAHLRAETDAEVRRIAEESRRPLLDQIRELERTRNFLRDDVELLERHLQAQRERLRGQVAELARLIDEPAALRVDPTPATSGVDPAPLVASVEATPPPAPPAPPRPAFSSSALTGATFGAAATMASSPVAPPPVAPAAAPAPAAPVADAPAATSPLAQPGAGAGAAAAWVHEHVASEPLRRPLDEAAYDDAAEFDDEDDEFDDEEYEESDEFDDDYDDELDDEDGEFDDEFDDDHGRPAFGGNPVWADEATGAAMYERTYDAGGGSTPYAPTHAEMEGGGDQFLEHLRRAVDEDADADDGAMTAFFSAPAEEAPRSRFGFRR